MGCATPGLQPTCYAGSPAVLPGLALAGPGHGAACSLGAERDSPNHCWKHGARQTESTPAGGEEVRQAASLGFRVPHPPLPTRGHIRLLATRQAGAGNQCRPARTRVEQHVGLDRAGQQAQACGAAGAQQASTARKQGGLATSPRAEGRAALATTAAAAAAAAAGRGGAPGSCSSSGGSPSARRYRSPRSAALMPACEEPAGGGGSGEQVGPRSAAANGPAAPAQCATLQLHVCHGAPARGTQPPRADASRGPAGTRCSPSPASSRVALMAAWGGSSFHV